MKTTIAILTLASALIAAEPNQKVSSQSPAYSKKHLAFRELAEEINDKPSKAYLQSMAVHFLTINSMSETEALRETAKQLDTLIAACMFASKSLNTITDRLDDGELRKAIAKLDHVYVEGLGYLLAINKGQTKGTRKLTETNWRLEEAAAVRNLTNTYVPLLTKNKLTVSREEDTKISDLILSLSSK